MRSDGPDFASLDRQGARIDSLDLYLRACRRRGTTDEQALQAYVQESRLYRRALARLSPEQLFEYASSTVRGRRVH